MNELSSRGSGVPPVKSTFALRRDAGATNDAQILNMSQSTFTPHQIPAKCALVQPEAECLY